MRVLFCWPNLSGYMGACWRALAKGPGVDLQVLAFGPGDRTTSAFTESLVADIPCRLLDARERQDEDIVARLAVGFRPDVLVLCGWFHRPYTRLLSRPEFRDVPCVMGMDTPWQGRARQHLARLWLRRLVGRMALVVVSGERSWQYARRLGAPEARIRRGLYGIDAESLFPCHARRLAGDQGWPRRFLYVGRLEPVKGIDVLAQAYTLYRQKAARPWPLSVCGIGPQADLLQRLEGVEYHGFVQPFDLPDIWTRAGAFVLASRFDPWPLVLVEASASGLPVLCTEACGSAVEVVRPFYNGLTVASEDPPALARAMHWIDEHHSELGVFGERSQALAAAYAVEHWARRWHHWLAQVLGK